MAAALPQAGIIPPLRFRGLALQCGTPIDLEPIAANGGKFWIGKNTTTFCPEVDNVDCNDLNTNQTIFNYVNGAGTLFLDAIVPGGQQAYITAGNETAGQAAGELLFTPAHSAATQGPALLTGFVIAYEAKIQFEGQDWFACPVDEWGTGYGIWSKARTEGSNAGAECIEFIWRVTELDVNAEKAWQYSK